MTLINNMIEYKKNNVVVSTYDLKKEYEMGRAVVHALSDVTMEITQGEFVALVGASGSGKSTLLNLIGGLDRPTSGKVEVCGKDLAGLSSRELAEHRKYTVGMVFQSFNLIQSMTAADNVALALAFGGVEVQERRSRTESMLGLLDLSDRMNHKPSELSGGEQQRTAIARALINRPEILLADEPTGNLDGRTSIEIMELLRRINQNDRKTIIVVTHNESLALRYVNRIIRLSYGRIIT